MKVLVISWVLADPGLPEGRELGRLRTGSARQLDGGLGHGLLDQPADGQVAVEGHVVLVVVLSLLAGF